jgi:sulfate permease, SulP family
MTANTLEHGREKKPGATRQGMSIIVAGAIGGLDGIGFAVAVATLFFAGSLSSGTSMAAGVCLLASVIFSIFIGWRSEIRSNTAQIQDMGVAVLTGTLAVTAAQMQAGPDVMVATAFAILAVIIATGLLLSVTGWLRAGRIVRYFPLEVLAGFMAGTGWLLASGSMAAVTGKHIGSRRVARIEQSANDAEVLASSALWHCNLLGNEPLRHPLTFVGILGSGIAIFYAWLFWSGGTVESAAAQGLLPTVDVEASLQLPFPGMLHLVDWSVVWTGRARDRDSCHPLPLCHADEHQRAGTRVRKRHSDGRRTEIDGLCQHSRGTGGRPAGIFGPHHQTSRSSLVW